MTIDIAHLRALANAAPLGIFTIDRRQGGDTITFVDPRCVKAYGEMHAALPALCDEVERLTKILDDRRCNDCGGAGEHCIDRAYGGEHYQDIVECPGCNGDGRTESGAQKKIAALTAERDRLAAECHGRRFDPNLVRENQQLCEQLNRARAAAQVYATRVDALGLAADDNDPLLRGLQPVACHRQPDEERNVKGSKTPTKWAIQNCAHWLRNCISLGWRSDQMVELERIWWRWHDNDGALINAERSAEDIAASMTRSGT